MNRESHISSLVIHVRPECLDAVRSDVLKSPGVEIHAVDEAGKIVLTLEADDMGAIQEFMNRLALLPGVLSSNLVYHHCEDAESLAEEIEYENQQT